jgi:hypothetical protein
MSELLEFINHEIEWCQKRADEGNTRYKLRLKYYAQLKQIVEMYYKHIIEPLEKYAKKYEQQERGEVGEYVKFYDGSPDPEEESKVMCVGCGRKYLPCCITNLSQARPKTVTREWVEKWRRGYSSITVSNAIKMLSEIGVEVGDE